MPYKDDNAKRLYQRELMRKRRAAAKAGAAVAVSPSAPASNPALAFVEWAESTLIVPTGPKRGQPFRIPEWQREYVRQALADGVREAGLSVARKNGKSGLIAALALAYLAGPLNAEYWRGLVVSLTGGLAKELRDAVQFTAEASGVGKSITVYRSPAPGRIEGLRGSRLDILASDRATGHAVGGDLAIIDESGLMPEAQRALWAALASSLSGRDGRLWAISIRGDGPMFRELSERADGAAVRFIEHAAPVDAAIDDVSAWHAANPGLADGIKSESYMRDAARRSLASPADQAAFRAYDLNQPQAPSREMIVSLNDWQGCIVAADDLPARAGECVLGFDLGGSSSMTAAVALWPRTGRVEAWGAFPTIPELSERSKADAVGSLYVQMHERGEVSVYEGRVTPAAAFLADVAARLAGEHIVAAGADRYRRAEAIDALAASGARWPVVWRGQGASATADGSADVRAFQRLVLGGKLRLVESLLLASAITESSIRRDVSGNPAIAKARENGRIDALSAAVIACGLGERVLAKPERVGGSVVL